MALASGRDFDDTGNLSSPGSVVVLAEAEARSLATGLAGAPFAVKSMTHKPFRRSPSAPFMTSTLQQEAGRKLRFSSKRAMQIAQRLYEDGWITYMRTDSTTLSSQALSAARAQASTLYGPEYVPAQPRRYERKVKNAQEAHEAIRPAGESFRTPDEAARSLSGDEFRLYDLIWKRTVASQMADATGTSAQVRLVGTSVATGDHPAREAEFSASGKVIQFPGYLRAYVEGEDDPRPNWPTGRSTCPPWPRATRRRSTTSSRAPTPPSRRPATPRRRWSRPWRSWAWAARPPTPASSPPSSTGATCGRRARPWSPRSPPSPWSGCWSGTSPTWSTTGSPPRWRTTSTPSPRGTRSRCPG